MPYPKPYNLDGIFYRVERDGKWENHCLSDLALDEIDHLTKDYKLENWQRVAYALIDSLRRLGELLEANSLVLEEAEEDN